jgi:hypothetical protein
VGDRADTAEPLSSGCGAEHERYVAEKSPSGVVEVVRMLIR